MLNCCCQANCVLSTTNGKHKVLAKHVFNSACYYSFVRKMNYVCQLHGLGERKKESDVKNG